MKNRKQIRKSVNNELVYKKMAAFLIMIIMAVIP